MAHQILDPICRCLITRINGGFFTHTRHVSGGLKRPKRIHRIVQFALLGLHKDIAVLAEELAQAHALLRQPHGAVVRRAGWKEVLLAPDTNRRESADVESREV